MEYVEVTQAEPLRAHFADVVTGALPLTDGIEGLSVVKVLSAASSSQSSGDTVRLGS